MASNAKATDTSNVDENIENAVTESEAAEVVIFSGEYGSIFRGQTYHLISGDIQIYRSIPLKIAVVFVKAQWKFIPPVFHLADVGQWRRRVA